MRTATENQLLLETTGSEEIIDIPESSNRIIPASNISENYYFPKKDFKVLEIPTTTSDENVWNSWLWGQINRILPIKFAVRNLAIETAEFNTFPKLELFAEKASKEARKFGEFLKNKDQQLDKPRDKKLSTGFPIGQNNEKSRSRYSSQFVGHQRSDGDTTGAVFDLLFADLFESEDGIVRIGLTSPGKEFSLIKNPVIDKNVFNSSLSPKEIEFYGDHIISFVPGEVSLFLIILKLIDNGVTKRETMNKEIGEFVKGSDWSEGMISTQRSGAISRMYELNLISKERIGLEVRYRITPSGKNFMERAE